MLMYNTTSFGLFVFSFVPLMMLQNGKLFLDIALYQREREEKTNFVRLVGYHDATYTTLLFTAVISFLAILDAFAIDWLCLGDLCYIPFILFMFLSITDQRQSDIAKNWVGLMALVGTGLALYGHLQLVSHVAERHPTNWERSYPLYVRKDYQLEEVEELTFTERVYSRFNISGFWFAKDWVFGTWFNYIIMPYYRYTIKPVFTFVYECIYGTEEVTVEEVQFCEKLGYLDVLRANFGMSSDDRPCQRVAVF